MIALLDAELDELLQPLADRAGPLLTETRQAELEAFVARARTNSGEVTWLSYLYLSERFALVRELS